MNCDDEDNKPFCGSMRVEGFPTLKTVKVTGQIGKPIIQDYRGPRTAADIVEATKKIIPNYVDRVDQKDFSDWLQKKNDSAKAILFSNKGATSALIKSLANDFRSSLTVAQVRDKEKEINSMFGVEKYPTLVVLPGGDKPAAVYDGEMKKPAMSQFLSKYAELTVVSDKKSQKDKQKSKESKSDQKVASPISLSSTNDTDRAKASSSDSSKFAEASKSHASEDASSSPAASASTITIEIPEASESPDPIANQDGPTPVAIPDVSPPLETLETLADLQSRCLSPSTHTCLLALLPAKADPEAEYPEKVTLALGSLADLAQKHKTRGDHLFPFYAVPASNLGKENLANGLGLEKSDDPQLITVNGKRKWWKSYDSSSKGFGSSAIEDWVDGMRMGEGKKHKLPSDLLAAEATSEASSSSEKPSEASSPAESSTATESSSDSASATESKATSIIHEDL